MKKNLFGVLAVVGGVAACNGSRTTTANDSPTPAPSVAAPPVDATGALAGAHQAYLDGDFLALGDRVRDVILDSRSSELVKENAYELLDKAFEVQKGTLPSRFVLPPGMEGVKFGIVHGATEQRPSFYRIYVYGRMRDTSRLRGVSLKALPDTMLLDSTQGLGDLSSSPEGPPGWKRFVLERSVPEPPADGVLSLRFSMADGTASDGWFVSHAMASSATPELKSPLGSSSLSDVRPVVSWVPFRSPEIARFERRTLSVYVTRDGDDKPSWDFWTQDYGDLAEVRVGAHPPAASTSLIPGDYWLSVTCGEARTFGPVALSRDSRATAGFHLVP